MHRAATALVIVALGLAACVGSSDDASPADAPTVTADSSTVDAPTPDEPAADGPDASEPDGSASASSDASDSADAPVPELLRFTAPLVGGGEFDAAATGGTPTAFWFWSPT